MSPSYETPASPAPIADLDPTPVVRRPGANGHPCDEACGWANSARTACTCICGGARHGSFRATPAQAAAARADTRARIAATGDVFLGAAAPAHEEW